MTLQSLFDQAASLHRRDMLQEAERLYLQILAVEPAHVATRYQLGLLRFQQGRGEDAVTEFQAALLAQPDHADALYNRGTTLAHLGRHAEALASFERGLEIETGQFDTIYNRGIALWHLGRAAEALGDFDCILAAQPQFAPAWNNRGNALRTLRRTEEALQNYRKALEILPDYREAWNNLCTTLFELGRIEEGMEAYRRAAEMAVPSPAAAVAPHRQRHDAEQREYLNGLEKTERHRFAAGACVPGQAVNAASGDIAGQWRARKPQIAVIDDLLMPQALEGLRNFCLASLIWQRSFDEGYLGAFAENGFACPLLAQIAEELPARFPAIFGAHPLQYLWAFKYESRCTGIKVHADFAIVNVNFWITPDDANLDPGRGGLVIWDVATPADWDFARYNGEAAPIREFLGRNGAKSVTVPYRANRAVIFDSDLFHETDHVYFKPGYQNRRINVTLLYGRRGEQG